MLDLMDVHSYYGGAHILQGVTFSLPEGQVLALLGRNGMGKTTLVRSVLGMHPPHVRHGEVRIDADDVTGLSVPSIARRGLAVVPQGRRIFGSLTVTENLEVAERGGRTKSSGIAWTRDDVHELFPVLHDRPHQKARSLSGGEQAMLAIARALLARPRLLIMDEPSEGLAPVIVERLEKSFLELKQSGLTILLVEQNLHVARSIADRILIIDRGEISTEIEAEHFEHRWEDLQSALGV